MNNLQFVDMIRGGDDCDFCYIYIKKECWTFWSTRFYIQQLKKT